MQQQKKRRLLIGLAWLLKLWFFGYVSIYQEFVEKKKKKVLGFKFLGFLGDGFGVKEKKKGRHGRIVSDRHGHPLVIY
jgi:hypothetical protein